MPWVDGRENATPEERKRWKADALARGDFDGWYNMLDKEDIMAMLCDVIRFERLRLDLLHEDTQRAYAIHRRRERR